MKAIIGSAKLDENKKIVGGEKGDQKQKDTPDYKGEVALQDFYISSKGWDIIRAKDIDVANKMADLMILACNNINIGYSQSDRNDIISKGIRTTIPANCDCSSLVRQVIKEASGKDPGNFNTSNELTILTGTGMFSYIPFTNERALKRGDILSTKTKGHTAIVVKTVEPEIHNPLNYLNNHIYIVCVDDLNVRTKLPSQPIISVQSGKVSRKLNVGDRITCIRSEIYKGYTWIYMGLNSNNQEEWCCADNGSKSYVK